MQGRSSHRASHTGSPLMGSCAVGMRSRGSAEFEQVEGAFHAAGLWRLFRSGLLFRDPRNENACVGSMAARRLSTMAGRAATVLSGVRKSVLMEVRQQLQAAWRQRGRLGGELLEFLVHEVEQLGFERASGADERRVIVRRVCPHAQASEELVEAERPPAVSRISDQHRSGAAVPIDVDLGDAQWPSGFDIPG